ncbi:MAG: hypothetical protein WBO77_02915 [Microgenomates group bacterium]
MAKKPEADQEIGTEGLSSPLAWVDSVRSHKALVNSAATMFVYNPLPYLGGRRELAQGIEEVVQASTQALIDQLTGRLARFGENAPIVLDAAYRDHEDDRSKEEAAKEAFADLQERLYSEGPEGSALADQMSLELIAASRSGFRVTPDFVLPEPVQSDASKI